jgi:exo-1,4-beta-D-glucosaminidase
VEPKDYYRRIAAGRDWLFKDEVGIPSVPPLASLERFIPELDPQSDTLTDTWGYHDAAEGNGRYSLYHQAIADRYGEPRTLAEYAWKAQFVNAENYRAIFEAANHDLGRTAGVILWKTNAAWPSVIWQVYDWYLRPNAGYYYAKNASQPLHVQLHPERLVISGVNASLAPERNLALEVDLYDEHGSRVGEAVTDIALAPDEAREVLRLGDVPGWDADAFRFVRLRLVDPVVGMVDENFYWLAPDDDFRALNELAPVELTASAHRMQWGGRVWITLTLTNPSDHLAFFVNPVLTRGPGGAEILPTFWSDNYFSMPPGETKTVVAYVDPIRLEDEAAMVRIEGWNVTRTEVPTAR